MCRPHFHTPLHPWLPSADASKSMMSHHPHGHPAAHPSHAAWCSPFAAAVSGKTPSAISHPHSSPHLLTFPPTPPEDAASESAAAAAAAVAAAAAAAAVQDFNDRNNSGAMDLAGSAHNNNGSASPVDHKSGGSHQNNVVFPCFSSGGSDLKMFNSGNDNSGHKSSGNGANNSQSGSGLMFPGFGSSFPACSVAKPREGNSPIPEFRNYRNSADYLIITPEF